MEVDPDRDAVEDSPPASFVEAFALLAVRLIALPFLVVGIVLWALVLPLAAVARSIAILLHPPRRGGGPREAWISPVAPRDA